MLQGPLLERIFPVANAPSEKRSMNRVPARESIWIVRPIVISEASVAVGQLEEHGRRACNPRIYRALQSRVLGRSDANGAVPNHSWVGTLAIQDETDV
jgi:hypothetical protein